MNLNIYVDGSYNKNQPGVTKGGVVITKGYGDSEKVLTIRHLTSDNPVFTRSNNAGGEVLASLVGIMNAATLCNGEKSILNIYYDYKGVKEFITGGYRASDEGMLQYVYAVRKVLESNPNIELKFHKVKAHSGVKFNELADKIAKGIFPYEYSDVIKSSIAI